MRVALAQFARYGDERIVAALLQLRDAAVAREVPPGMYPVRVALAQFARYGDERIVAALLQLRDAAVARWEPAHWGRDAASASPEIEQGEQEEGATGNASTADVYCVDSGFGAFMDEAAIEALLEHIDAEDDEDYLQGRWESLGPVGGTEWFDIPMDEETGANILLFTSGWGTVRTLPTGALLPTVALFACSRTLASSPPISARE